MTSRLHGVANTLPSDTIKTGNCRAWFDVRWKMAGRSVDWLTERILISGAQQVDAKGLLSRLEFDIYDLTINFLVRHECLDHLGDLVRRHE